MHQSTGLLGGFHQKRLCTWSLLFIYNSKSTSSKCKNFVISCRYSSSNKQQNIFVRALPAPACPFYGLACVACGGNKCHWCNVAIVERLNRYRGISQKRSVKSSCIGWLSCMLGKPSQRYRHTSTGSAWEKVQNL